MAVEVKKQTKLEEFQEEIRLFRKYEEVVYHMIVLYEYLLNPYDMHSELGNDLIMQVIHDMEEATVLIPYKGDINVTDIIEEVIGRHYSLVCKYNDFEECRDLASQVRITHKDYFKSLLVRNQNMNNEQLKSRKFRYKPKPSFNLIHEVLVRSTSWATHFLVSDISLDIRLEMFNDILKDFISQDKYYYVVKFLKFEDYNYSGMDSKLMKEKWRELLNAFTRDNDKFRYFFESLLEHERYDIINELQDDVFDFNSFYWSYNFSGSDFNGIMISTVGAMCSDPEYNKLEYFKKLYQSDSYLQVDENARYGNDLMILEFLQEEDLVEFIGLSNFELEGIKIDRLAKRILDKQIEFNRNDFDLRNSIRIALVRKMKNKKNKYKFDYATMFMEKSDFEKGIDKTLEEKENSGKSLIKNFEFPKWSA